MKYLPQPPAIPKSKTIAMLPYPLASFLSDEANSVISTRCTIYSSKLIFPIGSAPSSYQIVRKVSIAIMVRHQEPQ